MLLTSAIQASSSQWFRFKVLLIVEACVIF
jgi:hypothetical protein